MKRKLEYSSLRQCAGNMVSPRRKSTNLHKLFCYVLLLGWIVNVAATVFPVQVGGNVSIYCPVDPQQMITYFYLQRPLGGGLRNPEAFVNGFNSENDMSSISKWNNTRLDPHNKTTVHMYNVTLKHAGVYECHFNDYPATTVNLNVTAKYSKPDVMLMNISELGLSVTCKSYGGYPSAEFTWNVSGNEEWRVTTKNTKADKLTELVSTSSTVSINCSGVERSVSCSVGDSASDTFQVCQPTPPGNGTATIVGSVSVVLLLVVVLVGLLIFIKKRDRGRGEDGGERGDGGGQTPDEQEMEPFNAPVNGNA